LIMAFALLVSCERQLDYQVDTTPKIILNAHFDAGETDHVAILGVSEGNRLYEAPYAKVKMFVNGTLVSSVDSSEVRFGRNYYDLHAALKPGDKIRLEADYSGMNAYAETSIPYPTTINSVDTATVMLNEEAYQRFLVDFNDIKGESNYYRVAIKVDTYQDGEYQGTDEATIYNRNEPLLTSGVNVNEQQGSDKLGTGASYFQNIYNIFTDKLFADGSYRLNIMVPKSDLTSSYFKKVARVIIYTIPKEEYLYLSSIALLDSEEYSYTYLVEPIPFRNNVNGDGIGFVGTLSPVEWRCK